MLDGTKLKALADEKVYVTKIIIPESDRIENSEEKEKMLIFHFQ